MIIFKSTADLQSYLKGIRKSKKTVGFVPTMGALHNGHLSLISKSREKSDVTLCSIFVNPVQFNSKEDFQNYPLTVENDILLLEEAGCDILFMPYEQEVYPDNDSKKRYFELGYLENILEGAFRPGHFQGVCLIVDTLLNIIEPTFLFLGQKDYQQCLVIKRIIQAMKKRIKVIICPIVRETSGLAMSSRNLRLSDEEKKTASLLYKELRFIKKHLGPGNFPKLRNEALTRLEHKGFKIDYLELADSKDLHIIQKYDEPAPVVILIAAYLDKIRLVDNLVVA